MLVNLEQLKEGDLASEAGLVELHVEIDQHRVGLHSIGEGQYAVLADRIVSQLYNNTRQCLGEATLTWLCEECAEEGGAGVPPAT